MKMIRFNLWVVAVVLAVLLSGCKKTGNYYDVIPADAAFVLGVNVQDLMAKGEVKNLLGTALTQQMPGEVDGAMKEQIEQFFTDPQFSGLALGEKVFAFASVEEKTMCVAAKVGDEAKVTEFFTTLHKEGKCQEIEKKSGYRQVQFNENLYCAYNGQSFLLYFIENAGQATKQADNLMNLKAEQRIAGKEGFQKMLAVQGDVCYFLSMAKAQELAKNNPIHASMLATGMDLSKLEMLGGINFEKGKMVFSMEYFSEDAAALEMFKKQAAVCGKPTNAFLSYFPLSTLLYVSSNFNGEKLYQFMSEYNMLDGLKLPQVDMQKLLSSFDGDFSFGLLDISGVGLPSVALYAQVKDNYLVSMLAGLQEQFGMLAQLTKKGENAYEVAVPMLQMSFWFGIYDKFFYLTNDSGVYAKLGQNAANPLSDNAAVAELMKNTLGGYYINMATIMELPFVRMMSASSSAVAEVCNVLSVFDYMEAFMPSPESLEFVVYAKDKEQNILKTCIEAGKGLVN